MNAAASDSARRARELFAAGQLDESLAELLRFVRIEEEVNTTGQPNGQEDEAGENRAAEVRRKRFQDVKRVASYNRAVVEWYKSDFRAIAGVVRATRDYLPEALARENGDGLREKLSEEQMSFISAAGGAVPLYNEAVIAFYNRDLSYSRRILEFLFSRLDGEDDWFVLRTCFLLLDIYMRLDDLHCGGPIPSAAVREGRADEEETTLYLDRSKEVLSRVESTFSQRAEGDPTNDRNDDGDDTQALARGDQALSAVCPPLLLDSAQDPDGITGAAGNLVDIRSLADDSKFAILMYRARLEARRGNVKVFRKDVKSAVVAAEHAHGRPIASALMLKARMEKSPRKALKLLGGTRTEARDQHPVILNNLGVCFSRLGQCGLAALTFAFALEKSASWSGSTTSTLTRGSIRESEIAYNLGIQLLQLGECDSALQAFYVAAVEMGPRNPMLWVRVAEALIGCCETPATDELVGVIGRGMSRKIVIDNTQNFVNPVESQRNIELAASCCKEALELVEASRESARNNQGTVARPHHDKESLGEDSDDVGSTALLENGSKEPVQSPSLSGQTIREAALCIISYCFLSLGIFKSALDTTREILDIESVTPTACCTAHLYAAEALCEMGKEEEALAHLAAALEVSKSKITSAEVASIYVDISVAHARKGNIADARKAMNVAVEKNFKHPALTILAVYLNLKEGLVEEAISLLQHGMVKAER